MMNLYSLHTLRFPWNCSSNLAANLSVIEDQDNDTVMEELLPSGEVFNEIELICKNRLVKLKLIATKYSFKTLYAMSNLLES